MYSNIYKLWDILKAVYCLLFGEVREPKGMAPISSAWVLWTCGRGPFKFQLDMTNILIGSYSDSDKARSSLWSYRLS
jgi:hypothetical protein